MNTPIQSKPVVRPAMLAIEYRPKGLPQLAPEREKRRSEDAPVPAYVKPSAEIAYGCVDWFRYDKYEDPLKRPSGSAGQTPDRDARE